MTDETRTPASISQQVTTTSVVTSRSARAVMEREVAHYNPAENNYDLPLDPHCLFGWGPGDVAGCHCMFGHACFRYLGHPGMCWDAGEEAAGRRVPVLRTGGPTREDVLNALTAALRRIEIRHVGGIASADTPAAADELLTAIWPLIEQRKGRGLDGGWGRP